MIFNGVAEFKRYWNKNISPIPMILKDGQKKLADPELFVQLFFIGQDKKDTSNIINKGYYKKDDFINLLYAFMNIDIAAHSSCDIDSAKARLATLKENRSLLFKEHKILKSQKNVNKFLSAICDKNAFEAKVSAIERLQFDIFELKKSRNSITSRRLKCQETLKELKSLNRTLDHGEVRCLDCNSLRIGFKVTKKATCSFDISTPELRESIIASINEKIDSFVEETEKLTLAINKLQDQIKTLLDDEEITLEAIVAYKKGFIDASDSEKKIIEIDNEIRQIEQEIDRRKQISTETCSRQTRLIDEIIKTMAETYKKIAPNGNIQIDGLFSARDKIYSGSEATIFHLIKLFSIAKITQHRYPILIDSFRAEDLSTCKEDIVLDIFSELSTQKIFTTTLKREEIGKYDNDKRIYHIDYTDHAPSKMLNTSCLDKFHELLQNLAIQVS